jgi:hypothetical protein
MADPTSPSSRRRPRRRRTPSRASSSIGTSRRSSEGDPDDRTGRGRSASSTSATAASRRQCSGAPGDAHQALTFTWLANRPGIGLIGVHLMQKALDASITHAKQRCSSLADGGSAVQDARRDVDGDR